jgi:hypothetical protein
MAELRKQSKLDDRYMVLVSDQVVICDLSRAEAKAILKALERVSRA